MTAYPPPPPVYAHPEGLPTGQVVEPLIFVHGAGEKVVAVAEPAPPLTAIGVHMLDELADHLEDDGDVLAFPGGHRYLIGARFADGTRVYLHRIPGADETPPHPIGEVVCHTEHDVITGVTRVVVDQAPPRAAISRELLGLLAHPVDGHNPHMRQQTEHGDTLILPGGIRYRIGVPIDAHTLLLTRLPDETHPLVG